MPNFIDLTGKTFGRLTVLQRTENHILPNKKPRTQWLCRCSCGREIVTSSQGLRQGTTLSCGCLRRERFKRQTRSMVGEKYGKLTVISQAKTRITKTGQHKIMWNCQCDCGSFVVVEGWQLRSGKTQSCGCVKSRLEEVIANVLNSLFTPYRKQLWFDDLKTPKGSRTYFDFAIYSKNKLLALIEAQGIQHYVEESCAPWFGAYEREITDPLKREYCKINHIPFLEISFQDNPEYEILSLLIDLQGNTVPSIFSDEGVTTIPKGVGIRRNS